MLDIPMHDRTIDINSKSGLYIMSDIFFPNETNPKNPKLVVNIYCTRSLFKLCTVNQD